MVGAFEANDFPMAKFSCKKGPNVQSKRAEKLLNDLSVIIETNNLIYVDADRKIWQNLKFDVRTSVENSSDIEATAAVDKNGVKTIANHQIKKTRRLLRVGVTEAIPYTYYLRDPRNNKILRDEFNQPMFEGFCIDFINELSRKMDFSFELVEPTSGKFGERARDGSFDGLIGDLINGETDLIVAVKYIHSDADIVYWRHLSLQALKMTADREEQIDFVAPYFDQTGVLIAMKKPIPDTSLFKFMTVLRLEVWLSILGALSITAVVIWILEIFSPYSARNWSYSEQCRWVEQRLNQTQIKCWLFDIVRKFTLRESFWFALTSFTPQGNLDDFPLTFSLGIIYWIDLKPLLFTIFPPNKRLEQTSLFS